MAGEDVVRRIVDLINRIEEAVTTPGLLQLNESLCRYTLERLLETRKFLLTEAVQNSKERIPKSLEELHRIVTEAEANVRECCSSAWIPAAIQQAKNKEAFFEVLKDLHWCTGLVITALRNAIAESDDSVSDLESPLFVEHTPSADEKEENSIRSEVNKAAELDKKELKSKLNEITDSEADQAGLNENEVGIAKHLKPWIAGDDSISRSLTIHQGPRIGRGASGPVFRSTWQGQTIAEKCFHVGIDARESFKEEAKVMRKRRHPNVIKLVAKDDAKCKLVLELMDGSLKDLIEQGTRDLDSQGECSKRTKGPFPLPVSLDILLQIAKGMLFLHGKKVAHRDIKSGNILYLGPRREHDCGGYVRVKVADFGLAKVKEASAIAMTADLGTLQWTAPELFWKRKGQIVESKGKYYVNVKHALRADVYSFAITCFELLTGETNPYGPPGAVPKLAHKVAEEGLRPELPEHLPPALADLVQVCWAQDPDDRPTFKEIYKFLRDFKASLLLDSPIFSYPPWNSKMDLTSCDPENEPEVVGPKFSVTAWAISAVSWLFITRFKSLEEITDWDVRSRQMSYEMLQAAAMGGESNNMRPVRLSRGVEAIITKTIAQSGEVFLKRAFFLTQLEAHPNIPKIIGYSVHNNDFYLVHKADSVKVVGSLHAVMGLAEGDWRVRHHLTWEQRYNIALGVGKALACLHELSTPIIHGNLSSKNIMLEKGTYNPKLFNFYMSYMFPDPEVHSNFPTNDTLGWNAPEKNAVRGDETALEQDVFSFGVLLLVLVTGKNAFIARNMSQHVHIVDEAWKYFNEGRLMELEGPDVNGQSDELFRVLKLALHCVQKEPDRRPKIAEAVDMLLGKTQLKVTSLRRLSLTPARVKDQKEPSSSSAINSGRNASDVSERAGR